MLFFFFASFSEKGFRFLFGDFFFSRPAARQSNFKNFLRARLERVGLGLGLVEIENIRVGWGWAGAGGNREYDMGGVLAGAGGNREYDIYGVG